MQLSTDFFPTTDRKSQTDFHIIETCDHRFSQFYPVKCHFTKNSLVSSIP